MGTLSMIKITSFHLLAGILLVGLGSPNLDGTAYGSGGASLERDHTQMSDIRNIAQIQLLERRHWPLIGQNGKDD